MKRGFYMGNIICGHKPSCRAYDFGSASSIVSEDFCQKVFLYDKCFAFLKQAYDPVWAHRMYVCIFVPLIPQLMPILSLLLRIMPVATLTTGIIRNGSVEFWKPLPKFVSVASGATANRNILYDDSIVSGYIALRGFI